MSASQQHGFEIERIILADMAQRNRIVKKVPLSSSHISRFDAPGYSDPYGKGIPTSIKTAKKGTSGSALVCMADATRIGQLADVPMMRLLVALYTQEGSKKVFGEIREYLITNTEWTALMGGVSSETLNLFNNALKVECATTARAVAKEWKKNLTEEHPSVMRWNPKIDSKGQRRLQCSVHLKDLEAVIKDPKRIRVFGPHKGATASRLWGNGTSLPIVLSSPQRHRNSKPSQAPSAAKNSKSAPTTKGQSPRPEVARAHRKTIR